MILNLVIKHPEAIQSDSGTIVIKTQIKHHSGGLVPHGILNRELPKDNASFSVQDSGVGLDPERRELIRPVRFTKQNGRGLGLSVVLNRRSQRRSCSSTSPGVGSTLKFNTSSGDRTPPVHSALELFGPNAQ